MTVLSVRAYLCLIYISVLFSSEDGYVIATVLYQQQYFTCVCVCLFMGVRWKVAPRLITHLRLYSLHFPSHTKLYMCIVTIFMCVHACASSVNQAFGV
jgi:hypothetical protein